MHTAKAAHERKLCLAYNRPTFNIVQILPCAKSQRISNFTFYCPALRRSCIHGSEGVTFFDSSVRVPSLNRTASVSAFFLSSLCIFSLWSLWNFYWFSSDPPFLLLLLLLRFVCQARIFSDCLSGAFTVCQCVRQCRAAVRACARARRCHCQCVRACACVPVCVWLRICEWCVYV